MRYLLIVKATPDYEAGQLPSREILAEMVRWNEDVVKTGAMLVSERLLPSSKGTRVTYADRKITVTDGPFAETKELVAGACMIHAKSLGEAVDWAKRIPFRDGEVEIRPLLEVFSPSGESGQPVPPPQRSPGMIGYLAFIKSDSQVESGKFPEEKFIAEMSTFLQDSAKAGVFLTGEGLEPSSKSARVRYAGRERSVIDGPFAETKELVAGYCSLQFKSKAAAIEWAKQFVQVDAPGRFQQRCEIEMRPIFEYTEFGADIVEMFQKAAAKASNV